MPELIHEVCMRDLFLQLFVNTRIFLDVTIDAAQILVWSHEIKLQLILNDEWPIVWPIVVTFTT